MARVVREIMNAELFTVRPDARADHALEAILEFGINALPVIDDERRPVGVTALRDLVRAGREPRYSTPARSVSLDTPIEEAARVMAESGHHHLVVVASDGRAAGMVSSVDLLRALVGLPAKHPSTFPHRDPELGVSWSDASVLDDEHVDVGPEGGGVLVLSIGGVGRTETDVWVEDCAALRTRLVELLEIPQDDTPALARILQRRDLRFRCAVVADASLRGSIAQTLRARIGRAPLPRDAALVMPPASQR